jgi:hypothetical protein
MAMGHCHADGGPDFFFATKVTQGPLPRVHYTHIKRTPKSRCAICSGFEDTTKMTAHSRANGRTGLISQVIINTEPKNAASCQVAPR